MQWRYSFKRSLEGGNISVSIVCLCGWEASFPVTASVCRPVAPGWPALKRPVFWTKAIVTLTTCIRVCPDRTRASLENRACVLLRMDTGSWGREQRERAFFFFLKWYPRDPTLMRPSTKINFCSPINLGKHSSQNPFVKLTWSRGY